MSETDEQEVETCLDDVEVLYPVKAAVNFNCSPSCYFEDKKRKIDFVLVWTTSNKDVKDKESLRDNFIQKVKDDGLEAEEDRSEMGKKELVFLKIHATSVVLYKWAEILNTSAFLDLSKLERSDFLSDISTHDRVDRIKFIRNNLPSFLSCTDAATFRKDKVESFYSLDGPGSYFTPAQRSSIVYEILKQIVYGNRKKGEVGIDRLVNEGTFLAAYPLHDGHYSSKGEDDLKKLNLRQILYKYWGSYIKFYKSQPLEYIRLYFGEKVTMYFAWLGIYTLWLLPISIIGFLVFAFGFIQSDEDIVVHEICQSNITMCPACDRTLQEQMGVNCTTWPLKKNCFYAEITRIFDNPGMVFFSICVSLWSALFLEFWQRKEKELVYGWKVSEYNEEEKPRPEFYARARSYVKDPVTGLLEPTFPKIKKARRMLVGYSVLLTMVISVIIVLIGVIQYRVFITEMYYKKRFVGLKARMWANVSAAVINFIFIIILGKIYELLAYKLTNWEMHRTQTDYENHLSFKLFLFSVVNFFAQPFYIAFFKGKFEGTPMDQTHFMGLRLEFCRGSCFYELAVQFGVIMIGRQVLGNIKEMVMPKVQAYLQRRRFPIIKDPNAPRWRQELQLIQDNNGLFSEYLELVIQFGFITIFVAAFPLAPLLALFNNWFEIRMDARKFLKERRRTVAARSQNIGIWIYILKITTYFAILTNGCLIAFSSEFLPRIWYKYRKSRTMQGYIKFIITFYEKDQCYYFGIRDKDGNQTIDYWEILALRLGFLLLFEHTVLLIVKIVAFMVPDVPKDVQLKIRKRRYVTRNIFFDSQQ